MFWLIHEKDLAANELRNYHWADWAINLKISFNPDPTKQSQKDASFSGKFGKSHHPPSKFNKIAVPIQKYLGFSFDKKLERKSLKEKVKGIDVVGNLSQILSRELPVTVYRSFIRPHLDYIILFMINAMTAAFRRDYGLFNINQQ